jgi:hypothetical protein
MTTAASTYRECSGCNEMQPATDDGLCRTCRMALYLPPSTDGFRPLRSTDRLDRGDEVRWRGTMHTVAAYDGQVVTLRDGNRIGGASVDVERAS